MLGRKQASSHADWLRAWEKIQARPDHARAADLVEEAAERLERRVRGKAAAYGWSGGKDSLALEVVARRAGLEECVLVISALEYPAFLQWATDHMPHGLTVELREGVNLAWLKEHPEQLFPQTAAQASKWFRLIQHSGQRAYCAREGTEVLVLGRRRSDGNYLGARVEAGGFSYQDRGGFERYSPIGAWTHEDVLHVLASHRMELPPCYGWPRGFRVGTGAWPARQWTLSPAHGWSEVLRIDPDVVRMAAESGVPGAREALCAV